MNGYIAFYNGKQKEIYAPDMYSASVAAVEYLRVPKSKRGQLAVVLVEKAGEPVAINPASI